MSHVGSLSLPLALPLFYSRPLFCKTLVSVSSFVFVSPPFWCYFDSFLLFSFFLPNSECISLPLISVSFSRLSYCGSDFWFLLVQCCFSCLQPSVTEGCRHQLFIVGVGLTVIMNDQSCICFGACSEYTFVYCIIDLWSRKHPRSFPIIPLKYFRFRTGCAKQPERFNLSRAGRMLHKAKQPV